MQVENDPDTELAPQLGNEPPPNEPEPVDGAEGNEPVEGQEAEATDEDGQQRQPQDGADDSTQDEQAKARSQGWRPKSEWRGDPRAWIPAREFLIRGEQIMPILRSRIDRAERDKIELQQRIEQMEREQTERLRRLENVSRVALQQQAQQIHQQYEAMRRQAVERGDTEAYDQINQQYAKAIGELNQSANEAMATPEPDPNDERQRTPPPPETVRVVEDWIGTHSSWWNRDEEMTRAALYFHQNLMKEKPWMSVANNLVKTEEFLREEFPDRFEPKATAPKANGRQNTNTQQQTRQPTHAPVEGGGRLPGGGPRPKGWADVPAEDKRTAERMIRDDGLFLPDGASADKLTEQDIRKAREAYARAYWEQG